MKVTKMILYVVDQDGKHADSLISEINKAVTDEFDVTLVIAGERQLVDDYNQSVFNTEYVAKTANSAGADDFEAAWLLSSND